MRTQMRKLPDLPLNGVHAVFRGEIHADFNHRLRLHLESVGITLRLYLGEGFLHTAVELQFHHIYIVVAVSRVVSILPLAV